MPPEFRSHTTPGVMGRAIHGIVRRVQSRLYRTTPPPCGSTRGCITSDTPRDGLGRVTPGLFCFVPHRVSQPTAVGRLPSLHLTHPSRVAGPLKGLVLPSERSCPALLAKEQGHRRSSDVPPSP